MASASDDLFAAIDAGDVDRVGAMLDVDPSLAMARDHEGVSALLRARYRLDRALAEAVRARGAALEVCEAATFGDLDRLAVLLEADPGLTDRRSGDGFTALHLAAFFGQDDAVRVLLARGADPDAHGTGWMTGTPLNSAASAGHAATVDLLLESGADPDAVQRAGGHRCTRRRTTATRGRSSSCSHTVPTRPRSTTRVGRSPTWRRRALMTRRSRRSRGLGDERAIDLRRPLRDPRTTRTRTPERPSRTGSPVRTGRARR